MEIFSIMKRLILSIALILIAAGYQNIGARQMAEKSGRIHLKEIGFLSGWGEGYMEEGKDNYEIVPLTLRFGFDLLDILPGEKKKGSFDLLAEPFVNPVVGPDSSIEAGCNLLVKYARSLSDSIYPYVEAGTGMIYVKEEMERQTKGWNFLLQCGLGLNYLIRDDISLTAGYRYRHFSNGGRKHPNGGIDVNCFIAGISYLY